MQSAAISDALQIAHDVHRSIEELIDPPPLPRDFRMAWAMAAFLQCIELHGSLLILIDQVRHGSGLALLRPTYEAFGQGVWILEHLSNEEISELHNVEFPELRKLLMKLGGKFGFPKTSDNNNKSLMLFLNKLTHGSQSLLVQRMGKSGWKSDFDPRLVADSVHRSTFAAGASALYILQDITGDAGRANALSAVLERHFGRSFSIPRSGTQS